MANCNDHNVYLKKGEAIGYADEVHDYSSVPSENIRRVATSPSSPERQVPEHLKKLYDDTIKNVPAEHQHKVETLLTEFSDVFAKHDLDLGCFAKIQHRIILSDPTPVKQRLRRTPLGFQNEEEKHIQSMLEKGVISPSSSDYASAPVLIRKRDGSVRYCIDYRELNSRTVKDTFPLPLIEDCLDSLSGAQFFSTLDLAAGYWQIEIDPSDRHKTAFITKFGLYEYNRMSFGLCNAPASFQRIMNFILTGLTWRHVLAYLDDVIVLGQQLDDALGNLREVFLRFRCHNLKLKPKKCYLLRNEVSFLGRRVNARGVHVPYDKLDIIARWPQPTSQKELQAFLGFMNYHRDFIPRYAHISHCLYQLAAKSKPKSNLSWGEEHEDAFGQLKSILDATTCLAFPNQTGEFILDTDASDFCIGAALNQVQDEKEVPISFASKALLEAQKKYCTTRKELLAVVTFTRQFRHYLLGRSFTLRTDHHSLVWLMRFRQPHGQLARWLEELAQYDMKIIHRSGTKHVNADLLSRLPDPVETCPCYDAGRHLEHLPCGGCHYCTRAHQEWGRFLEDVDDVVPLAVRTVELTRELTGEPSILVDETPVICSVRKVAVEQTLELDAYTKEDLRTAQLADPDLEPLLIWKDGGVEPDEEELALHSSVTKKLWVLRRQLCVTNGVLYYLWEEEEERTKKKLIVPDSLRVELLQLAHDVSGHSGQQRTFDRLKPNFFWPKMRRDVYLYVQTCGTCNRSKKPSVKPKAKLGSYHAGAPMERLHIDILGPFVESHSGNKYVVMIVDQFTKWLECHAIPDQTAEVVTDVLLKQVIVRFGIPRTIHSDQGRNFESHIFQSVCRALEIAKTRTTPYRPCSNAQAERYNRTVLQMIRSYTGEDQKRWDEHLHLIGMAIRSMINRSTGFTANCLMLGREVSIPDTLFGIPDALVDNAPEYVKQLFLRQKQAHQCARDSLRSQQVRQQHYYNQKLKQRKFVVGDLVYKLDTTHVVGQSSKLRPIYVGPFLVTKVLSPVLYKITGRKKSEVLHHDRLRLCQDRDVPLWIRRRRNAILGMEDIEEEPEVESQGIDLSSLFHHPEAEEPVVADTQDDTQVSGTQSPKPEVSTRGGRRVKRPGWMSDYTA